MRMSSPAKHRLAPLCGCSGPLGDGFELSTSVYRISDACATGCRCTHIAIYPGSAIFIFEMKPKVSVFCAAALDKLRATSVRDQSLNSEDGMLFIDLIFCVLTSVAGTDSSQQSSIYCPRAAHAALLRGSSCIDGHVLRAASLILVLYHEGTFCYMARRKTVRHPGGAQLQWKVYGRRDDKTKISISDDGLEFHVADPPSKTIKCTTSESICSEQGDPFYVEFHPAQESEPPMNHARGHRYNM